MRRRRSRGSWCRRRAARGRARGSSSTARVGDVAGELAHAVDELLRARHSRRRPGIDLPSSLSVMTTLAGPQSLLPAAGAALYLDGHLRDVDRARAAHACPQLGADLARLGDTGAGDVADGASGGAGESGERAGDRADERRVLRRAAAPAAGADTATGATGGATTWTARRRPARRHRQRPTAARSSRAAAAAARLLLLPAAARAPVLRWASPARRRLQLAPGSVAGRRAEHRAGDRVEHRAVAGAAGRRTPAAATSRSRPPPRAS